ncbi:hypothetical protein F8O09_04100 [Pseudoclavibacter sp. CFCC 11306]|nr:hypothetical protein F8O09_04100 [Pseudoclavibacter sp. CFCC 11306]
MACSRRHIRRAGERSPMFPRDPDISALQQVVATALKNDDPSSIDPAEDVFDQGLDSLSTMEIVQRARDAGYTVTYMDLLEASTLGEWVEVLREHAPSSGV